MLLLLVLRSLGFAGLPPVAGAVLQPLSAPIVFEPNLGQTDDSVRFVMHSPGLTVFLTDAEAVMQLQTVAPREDALNAGAGPIERVSRAVVRMKLAGAAAPREVIGLDLVSGISNYYVGDPARHRTGVPHYARVAYREIYAGIDLICHGDGGMLEYDFVVAPGADPAQVQLAWEGADRIGLNERGELVLGTRLGQIVQQKPRVYQDFPSGRAEVAAKYILAPNHRVTIALASYDRGLPLVIDPPVYSTYLGGKSTDAAYGIAVNAQGEAFVTGNTGSNDFPNSFSDKNTSVGTSAVFVTRLSSDGSGVIYSTYFGGYANDTGFAIAVDATDSAYVTGNTASPNFLTPDMKKGAFQPVHGNDTWDAFVTKLSPTGAMVYSTYLGGDGIDQGTGIAVDSSGHAYVSGFTASKTLPTVAAVQGAYGKGPWDGFVAELSPKGDSLVFWTYLGGSASDQASAIALDKTGAIYVVGFTESIDFPWVAATAAQPHFGGTRDAFITKLAPSGASVIYSSYLGGKWSEDAHGVAVDASLSAYVVGNTASDPTTFPAVNAFQDHSNGNGDVFVAKLSPAGDKFVYLTYLGGDQVDSATGIALNGGSTEAYVTGYTASTTFPMVVPLQTYRVGQGEDAFVAKLSAGGNALIYSTYLGGKSEATTGLGPSDRANAIAVDVAGAAYVAGSTSSTDFPTVNPAYPYQKAPDAFVTKIADVTATGGATLLSPAAGSTLPGPTVTFTWSAASGATGYGLGIGPSQANDSIFQQEVGTVTSFTVNGIPANKGTIWVRLATQINGNGYFNDYKFNDYATGPKAVMTLPVANSVMPGSTVTFTWLPAKVASSYRLDIGTAVGLTDLYSKNVVLATSQVVTGLPVNGSTLYVRLSTVAGTVVQSNDYTYQAAAAPPPKGPPKLPPLPPKP